MRLLIFSILGTFNIAVSQQAPIENATTGQPRYEKIVLSMWPSGAIREIMLCAPIKRIGITIGA